ncbi:MAG: UDP-N-acetylmuramate dehydrogenase [Flavobacteriaceae bacterium]|nr:UDP-N-acetylmuramate dehydrogenase [Bacteroidia bacterium]NNF73616.1 UDP-N-acetylmuramate dehydrogenase [Flavobacteriaceae bacterium]
MTIQQNISLKDFNTFGLDVKAERFVSIRSEEALIDFYKRFPEEPKFILGGGSNILLTKDIPGIVLHIDLKGISIVSSDSHSVIIESMAGENWHEFVEYCLENDFGGIENLSLIPGNVGTAPIQNIGAYGVELKDVFESCRAFDIETKSFRTFTKAECNFGYRQSVFKQELKGKYIITSVRFRLSSSKHQIKTSYGAINEALAKANITNPTIQDVSRAVITIRESKLPNPKKIGNSGSFFKNPLVPRDQFDQLKTNFPNIPSYPVNDNFVKIPAGWLIEKSGFKGKRFGAYGVHDKQALVLVNHGNAKGTDILNLAKLIQMTIKRIFDINLEAEVNIID